jgi:hypothetical protein
MTKCFKCGSAEIAKGKITRSSEEFFSDIVFGPNGLRFLTLTTQRGTKLNSESCACLECGMVWSSTDPKALKEFIKKNCKGNDQEACRDS